MKYLLQIALFVLVYTTAFGQQTELKTWEFYLDKNPVVKRISIPHTWNSEDAFDDTPGYWRGKGYYSTNFEVSDLSKSYFLQFKGANQTAKVWVNEKLAGIHHGGYTAFEFDVSVFIKKGTNKVRVELDNTHDETVPPLEADFTFYGGIYRSVYLIAENKVHFAKAYGTDAVKIDPVLDEKLQGKVTVLGKVENSIKGKHFLQVTLTDVDNKIVYSERKKTIGEFSFDFAVKNPKTWSPEAPDLYNLILELKNASGKIVDVYKHKIGFSNFKVSAKGFTLNNKPLKLIGVNRHQDWKGIGNAVPINQQLRDLIRIKEMGGNFLRLAHYPQDEQIYTAADSLGIILWSETPLVNKVPITEDYVAYEKNSLEMQREHITQNYNHAAFIFVGYMNEILIRMVFDKDKGERKQKIMDYTYQLAEKLEKLTREMAPHKITVMAVHQSEVYNESKIAALPMVLGWNLYFGWYGGEIADLGGFLDEQHKRYPDRPLIISEYGTDADTRLHNDHPVKFDYTEEYQLPYNQGYLKQVAERDFVIGMAAWNFADFGSETRGYSIPHVNQKGLVRFDRTPKNIWFWYKAMLRPEEKMSRIYRGLPVYIGSSSSKNIKIISNQKVMVKLNGKNVGEQTPVDGVINLDVSFAAGQNEVEVFDDRGALQDSEVIDWQKPDFSRSKTLAVCFGTKSYFEASNKRYFVPVSQLDIVHVLGESKEIKSSTNILGTDDDPLYQAAIANVSSISIDVPEGNYKVTLYFSSFGTDKATVYELDKKSMSTGVTGGTYELDINGTKVEVETIQAFEKLDKTVVVKAKDKIIIKRPGGENFSVCGILMEKI